MKKCKSCWNILYRPWTRLVESETEEAYKINLAQIEQITINYPEALLYLNRTWLTPHKEKFVSTWTDRFLNFGNHTTNRVESQHAKLKQFIETRRSDIVKSLKRIDDVVESQYTAIKSSLQDNKNTTWHRFDIKHIKGLCGLVSSYALDIIVNEHERSKEVGFVFENCRCLVRTCYGLPCAHEQVILVNNAHCIPLHWIDTFWKKLDLLECKSPQNDDSRYDVEMNKFSIQMNKFNDHFHKQSKPVKLSLARKLLNVIAPSTTSVCDPAVHKTTRGRPPTKNKFFRKTHIDLNQDPPTQDPPIQDPRLSTKQSKIRPPVQATEDPRRHSFATYTPDYMGSNQFDLNQKPTRHSTYSFREQPTFNLHPLMDEIPNEFHQYVTNITDVEGDGNCGFRAIAVSLGYSEDYWPQIRTDLYNELLAHPQMYARIYEDDFNSLSHALNFRGTGFAPTPYWLIMPDTGFLIANRYGVIVYFLSKQGSSTCFPVMHGPEDILYHRSVVIALVYGGHYVKVDLKSQHPFPRLLPLWRHRCSERSARWETVYSAQLNAYISANPRRPGQRIEISDSY